MSSNRQARGMPVKKDLIDRLKRIYLFPEMRTREFTKLQIIFRRGETEPIVLFDEEAKIVEFAVKVREIGQTDNGATVFQWLEEPKNVVIEGEEDSLHATFKLSSKNTWIVVTNFLFNREYAKLHVKVAREYLEAAMVAFNKNQLYVCLDTLYSACELLIRIYLVSLPYIESPKKIRPHVEGMGGIRGRLKHEEIVKETSKLSRLNLIPEKMYRALTNLNKYRRPARYLQGELSIRKSEVESLLDSVKNFSVFMEEITEVNFMIPKDTQNNS